MCSDFHSADAVRVGDRSLRVQLHRDLLGDVAIDRSPARIRGAVGSPRDRRRDEQREGEKEEGDTPVPSRNHSPSLACDSAGRFGYPAESSVNLPLSAR
jgi:hypothetical protein